MSGEYSDWAVDEARNNADAQHWHVWRARWDGTKWDYDRRCITRAIFSSPQEYINWLRQQLRLPVAQTSAQTTNNPFNRQQTQAAVPRSTTPTGQVSYANYRLGGAIVDPRTLGRAGAATTMPTQRTHAAGVTMNHGLRLDQYTILSARKAAAFFKLGRCFKTHRTETDHVSARGRDEIYSEILRMVVVHEHHDHCLCIAVHTYNDQGTIGRRARDHVIIYAGDRTPAPLQGEDEAILARPPVHVRREKPEETAHWKSSSRLNLAKLYTVEHTVPVRNVGSLSQRTAKRVRQYVLEIQGLIPGGGRAQEMASDDEVDNSAKSKKKRR